jgi:hypothetical protein
MKVLLYAVFKDRRNATLASPGRNRMKFEPESEGRSLKAEQCSLTTRHLFEGCRRVEPAFVGTSMTRGAQTTLEGVAPRILSSTLAINGRRTPGCDRHRLWSTLSIVRRRSHARREPTACTP